MAATAQILVHRWRIVCLGNLFSWSAKVTQENVLNGN